jgi:hypothetical protein
MNIVVLTKHLHQRLSFLFGHALDRNSIMQVISDFVSRYVSGLHFCVFDADTSFLVVVDLIVAEVDRDGIMYINAMKSIILNETILDNVISWSGGSVD